MVSFPNRDPFPRARGDGLAGKGLGVRSAEESGKKSPHFRVARKSEDSVFPQPPIQVGGN